MKHSCLLLALIFMMTGCASSASTQLRVAEYDELNAQKQALTEQMVELNMSIEEAEAQNREIMEGLEELNDRMTKEVAFVEGLTEMTDELSAEEAGLNESLQMKQSLVSGWTLYQNIPNLVATQSKLHEILPELIDTIELGKDLQERFLTEGYFLMEDAVNQGVEVEDASSNEWYRLVAPYDSRTNLIAELTDAYTQEASIDVFRHWFSNNPNDDQAYYLYIDERLFMKASRDQVATDSVRRWTEARYFITELKEDQVSVRVVMPVMDNEDGHWSGDASDMHFYDHTFTMTKTNNGWRLNDPEFPELMGDQ